MLRELNRPSAARFSSTHSCANSCAYLAHVWQRSPVTQKERKSQVTYPTRQICAVRQLCPQTPHRRDERRLLERFAALSKATKSSSGTRRERLLLLLPAANSAAASSRADKRCRLLDRLRARAPMAITSSSCKPPLLLLRGLFT